MATPVSLCPLKRVEVHDGSTRKSFDASSQGNPLMISIEAQTSADASKSLVLLIQAGFQRLLSVRLSDLLKPVFGNEDIVSSDGNELRLSIRIPSQGQILIAYFGEARDHTLTVCTLQKAGFKVCSGGITGAPPISQHQVPLPTSSGTIFRPWLSSLTPIPNFGQPSHPPSLMSTQSEFTADNGSNSAAWPSFAHGGLSMSQPQLPSHSLLSPFNQGSPGQHATSPVLSTPSLTPIDAIDITGGMASNSVPHQPRVSSPLRYAMQPTEPFRSWSNPGTVSPYQCSIPSYPTGSQTQESQVRAGANSTLDLQPPRTSQMTMGRSSSDMCAGLLGDTLLADDEHRKQAADFKDLLPAPRRLPFQTSTSNELSMNKASKLAASKKRKASTDEAGSEVPEKGKTVKTIYMKARALPLSRRNANDRMQKSLAITQKSGVTDALQKEVTGNSSSVAMPPVTRRQDRRKSMKETTVATGKASVVLAGRSPKKCKVKGEGAARVIVEDSGGQDVDSLYSGLKNRVRRPTAVKASMTQVADLKGVKNTTQRETKRETSDNLSVEPSNVLERACEKAATLERPRTRSNNPTEKQRGGNTPPLPHSTPEVSMVAPHAENSRAGRKSRVAARAETSVVSKEAHARETQDPIPVKSKASDAKSRGFRSRPKARNKRSTAQPRATPAADSPPTKPSFDNNTGPPNVRTICYNCRKAHTRCSRGSPACARCRSHGLVCVYVPSRAGPTQSSEPPKPLGAKATRSSRKTVTRSEKSAPRTRSTRTFQTRLATVYDAVTGPLAAPDIPNGPPLTEATAFASQKCLLPVIFDTNMQKQLQELTEPLLQQYEADIARGCAEETSAKFYVERIHLARKEFWERVIRDSSGV